MFLPQPNQQQAPLLLVDVELAGAVYEREDLENLLNGVESAAGSWTMWPHFTWQILNSPIMKKQFGD